MYDKTGQLNLRIIGFFLFAVARFEQRLALVQGLIAFGMVAAGLLDQGLNVPVDFETLDRVGQQRGRAEVLDVHFAQHIVVEATDLQDLLALGTAE